MSKSRRKPKQTQTHVQRKSGHGVRTFVQWVPGKRGKTMSPWDPAVKVGMYCDKGHRESVRRAAEIIQITAKNFLIKHKDGKLEWVFRGTRTIFVED